MSLPRIFPEAMIQRAARLDKVLGDQNQPSFELDPAAPWPTGVVKVLTDLPGLGRVPVPMERFGSRIPGGKK